MSLVYLRPVIGIKVGCHNEFLLLINISSNDFHQVHNGTQKLLCGNVKKFPIAKNDRNKMTGYHRTENGLCHRLSLIAVHELPWSMLQLR